MNTAANWTMLTSQTPSLHFHLSLNPMENKQMYTIMNSFKDWQ